MVFVAGLLGPLQVHVFPRYSFQSHTRALRYLFLAHLNTSIVYSLFIWCKVYTEYGYTSGIEATHTDVFHMQQHVPIVLLVPCNFYN